MPLPAMRSHGGLGGDLGRRFRVDQGLQKSLPVGEDEVGGDGADMLEEAHAGAWQ